MVERGGLSRAKEQLKDSKSFLHSLANEWDESSCILLIPSRLSHNPEMSCKYTLKITTLTRRKEIIMHIKDMNRRSFIKSTVTATSAFALPRFSIAQPGKTKKINVAVVGVGGMGGYALGEAAKENLVAMCDVDDARAANAFKKFPNVPRFKDFRTMLDKLGKDIDAVSISTPAHTHFAAAMAAMERGKHVFVQKPLAHNVWQVRTLRKAARDY